VLADTATRELERRAANNPDFRAHVFEGPRGRAMVDGDVAALRVSLATADGLPSPLTRAEIFEDAGAVLG
jgi:hypothetical protein